MKCRFEYHKDGLSLIIPDEEIPHFEGILLSDNQSGYVAALWIKLREMIKNDTTG